MDAAALDHAIALLDTTPSNADDAYVVALASVLGVNAALQAEPGVAITSGLLDKLKEWLNKLNTTLKQPHDTGGFQSFAITVGPGLFVSATVTFGP